MSLLPNQDCSITEPKVNEDASVEGRTCTIHEPRWKYCGSSVMFLIVCTQIIISGQYHGNLFTNSQIASTHMSNHRLYGHVPKEAYDIGCQSNKNNPG